MEDSFEFGRDANTLKSYNPTFNDLLDNAEAGVMKRALNAYLFSRNPERTIKIHKFLGAAATRSVIMNTYGKYFPRWSGSNYRTDASKSRLEGATRFAVGGSVFNEAVHAGVAIWNVGIVYFLIQFDRSIIFNSAAIVFNSALVSLQRYNRAKMVVRINEELEAGREYDDEYTNWLGLDSRAVDNFYNKRLQDSFSEFSEC